MLKLQQLFQVGFLMVHDEIVRRTIHQLDEFMAFIDDGNPLAPGKHCRPKAHNLDILLFGEQMRDGYRVVFYKAGIVVLYNF